MILFLPVGRTHKNPPIRGTIYEYLFFSRVVNAIRNVGLKHRVKNLPFDTFLEIPREYFPKLFCTFLLFFYNISKDLFNFPLYKYTPKGILSIYYLAPITNNGSYFLERVVNTLQYEGRATISSS
jgi:hypothetical protein